MADEKTPNTTLDPKTHRRLLRFINAARSPNDLAFAPKNEIPLAEPEPVLRRPDVEEQLDREKLIEFAQARAILTARDQVSPVLGFAHIDQLRDVMVGLDLTKFLDQLIALMGPATFGEWCEIGQIQTDDGDQIDVVHAAMLRTGWVMFIEAACGLEASRTPLWNPFNRAEVEIRLPAPPTDNLYCSGHSFLSDGRLLVVGGGGDLGDTPHPNFAWLFDPVSGPAGSWSFTKDAFDNRTFLHFDRWYPTLVTLGDVPGRVLIASGRNPSMEIYEEATGQFQLVTTTGGDRAFNPLYPGLHLLPGGEIFFAPVGFASGGSFPADYPTNEPSGYFEFDNTDNLKGAWTNLEPNDRTKGMSVLLLSPTFPFAQVMIVGGGNLDKSRTYQIINLSHLSPTWQPAFPLPMAAGQAQPTSRVNVNPVLLPDGTVFVSGGAPTGEPSWLFNPATNTWSEMDEQPSERKYHSHALLLPTGEVMSCGWHNNTIEVFSPPYLFKGARPEIGTVPELVHLGEEFEICTPEAYHITKVVLVRPMAPTHNTDSEQRVVQLLFNYAGENSLYATAPNGWHPHATAPRGWYMLFILNGEGVPSVAKFIKLD
ncbi:MAG: galactose oxidase-like domain-containing protein [Blastocatellia bacterium]